MIHGAAPRSRRAAPIPAATSSTLPVAPATKISIIDLPVDVLRTIVTQGAVHHRCAHKTATLNKKMNTSNLQPAAALPSLFSLILTPLCSHVVAISSSCRALRAAVQSSPVWQRLRTLQALHPPPEHGPRLTFGRPWTTPGCSPVILSSRMN